MLWNYCSVGNHPIMPDLHHLYCSSNLLCCNGLFVELTNAREFLRGKRRTLNLHRSHSLYCSSPPACQWFIAGLVAPGSTFQEKSNLNLLAYCLPSSWPANTFFWRSLLWRMTCNCFHKALCTILSGELLTPVPLCTLYGGTHHTSIQKGLRLCISC